MTPIFKTAQGKLSRRVSSAMLLMLSMLFASHAVAQKVIMEFDQSVDFTKFKTFAIRNGHLNSRNPALNSELVKKQIETDIAHDLTARGLTQGQKGAPILTSSITLDRRARRR